MSTREELTLCQAFRKLADNLWLSALLNSFVRDPEYFAYVKKQFRDAGIVVPFISNDAWAQGLFAPGEVVNGTTEGDVDIYGHDSYPLGFNCAAPTVWPAGDLPTYFHATHEEQSPSTFYSLDEFQGGSFDPWGGLVSCAGLSST